MATPSYLTLLNTAGVSFSGASVVGSTLTGSTLTTNTAAIGSTLTGSTLVATANVGIGTTAPSRTFDVRGNVLTVGGTQCIGDIGVCDAITPANGYLRFATAGGLNYIQSGSTVTSDSKAPLIFGSVFAGTEWMRITTAGNVGIGTATITDRMSIYTPNTTIPTTFSIYNNYSGLNSSGNDYTIAAQYFGTGSYYASIQTRIPNGAYGDSTRLDFCTPNTFSSNVQTTRMSIMPFTGNVGIGTAAPRGLLNPWSGSGSTYGLYVDQGVNNNNNGIYVSNSNYGSDQGLSISMVNAGSSNYYSYAKIQGKTSGVAATTHITMQPDGGNVGIGTTAPVRTLHIFGTDATDVGSLIIQSSSTGNTYSSKYWSFGHNSSDGSLYLQSSHSSTANMYVRPNNAISTGWVVYSDRRLKQDITPVDTQEMLSRVRLIKPVMFRMRCPNNHALQMGVIAQDVQEVFPEMVSESHVTVMDVENPLGISFTSFIIPLLSAFQELDKFVTTKTDDHTAAIASLQSTIAAQQSTINALLDRVAKLESPAST